MSSFAVVLILLPLLLTACSSLQRHSESGYSANSRNSKSGWTKVDKTAQEAAALQNDKNLSQKTHIRHLENTLNTRKEIEQYSKALPWFKNEEERTEFLELPGFETRQKWIAEKSFMSRPSTVSKELQELVEAQDIAFFIIQNVLRSQWVEKRIFCAP
jgi:hypothetical protein